MRYFTLSVLTMLSTLSCADGVHTPVTAGYAALVNNLSFDFVAHNYALLGATNDASSTRLLDLYGDLVDRSTDSAFNIGPYRWSGLHSRLVASQHLFVAASKVLPTVADLVTTGWVQVRVPTLSEIQSNTAALDKQLGQPKAFALADKDTKSTLTHDDDLTKYFARVTPSAKVVQLTVGDVSRRNEIFGQYFDEKAKDLWELYLTSKYLGWVGGAEPRTYPANNDDYLSAITYESD